MAELVYFLLDSKEQRCEQGQDRNFHSNPHSHHLNQLEDKRNYLSIHQGDIVSHQKLLLCLMDTPLADQYFEQLKASKEGLKPNHQNY